MEVFAVDNTELFRKEARTCFLSIFPVNTALDSPCFWFQSTKFVVHSVRSSCEGEDENSGSAYSCFRDESRMRTYALECASSLRRKIDREDRFCGLVVVPLRLPFFELI